MIEIQNLSKSYGNHTVLENINLTLEKRNVYGIVGKNGAGKTTLFRCIAGLEEYEGKISSDKNPLKNHLGLLLSEPYFMPKMTGKEYVELLLYARRIKNQETESKNIFDLPLNNYATTYSTGMKKKLAIFAILLQQNDYFILDEPFNGVDIESNLIIVQIIKELKKLDKIILISSHIFSTLRDTCDQLYFLQNKTCTFVPKDEFDNLESKLGFDLEIKEKIEKLKLI